MEALQKASVEELSDTHEIGEIIAQSVYDFLHSPAGEQAIEDLKRVGVSMEAPRSAC